jgi:hypothetical protein
VTAYLVFAVAMFVALPLVVFRGRTLRKYLGIEIGIYVVADIFARQIPNVDPFLACVALFVAKLAFFSIVLATSDEVRWSANRAAAVALLVYALVIPASVRVPIDGDEPFYLLMTESIVQDFDLDLANQYGNLSRSATGRTDLVPQLGDRVGPRGEQYSHHEPFLPLLLIPGYVIAGLAGAVSTIAIFAALLVRSTIRFLEDEGIDERTARAVFPLFAFGPPVVFYAARIWPEVPGAFFFVEALRAMRHRRIAKGLAALLALCALKLRFALLAVPMLLRNRPATAVVVISLFVIGGVIAGPLPLDPRDYLSGLFGLLIDGAAGVLFQAPFLLLGLFALTRWRSMPEGFRAGMIASVLYVIYLVPRSEWHGGWSPPLRYIVFLTPVLALGAAAVWSRFAIPVIAVWTAGVIVHGIAYPWRLFHIANGENIVGEALSRIHAADFSRMFPSLIRLNAAAIVGAVIVVAIALVVKRTDRIVCPPQIAIALFSLMLAMFFVAGQRPGRVVHFEDAHVVKNGGELYPHMYQVARFNFRGSWMLHGGNSVSFQARAGDAQLHYAARQPVIITLGGQTYRLPPTGDEYGTAPISIARSGRVQLKVTSGSVNLDRIE